MFKLVKILNSNTTVPEIVKRNASLSEGYKRGSLLVMENNGTLRNVEVGQMPTHICCEDVDPETQSTVRCYEILETMVFEVPAIGNMQNTTPGSKITMDVDDDAIVAYASPSNQDGYVTLHDHCGAKKRGDTVRIRFIK